MENINSIRVCSALFAGIKVKVNQFSNQEKRFTPANPVDDLRVDLVGVSRQRSKLDFKFSLYNKKFVLENLNFRKKLSMSKAGFAAMAATGEVHDSGAEQRFAIKRRKINKQRDFYGKCVAEIFLHAKINCLQLQNKGSNDLR